jgi:hypothetical protein
MNEKKYVIEPLRERIDFVSKIRIGDISMIRRLRSLAFGITIMLLEIGSVY